MEQYHEEFKYSKDIVPFAICEVRRTPPGKIFWIPMKVLIE